MRWFRSCFALIVLLALPACAQSAASAPVPLDTEDQKTLYALGLVIANNLGQFNLTEAELAQVQAGIADGILKRTPKVDLQQYGPKLGPLAQARAAAAAEVEKKAAEGFLAEKAAEPGVTKTESGLLYSEIKAGTGASPTATDTVTVHYTGTLRDGKPFDSSVERGQPAVFQLNQVIPCWTEGLSKMKVGGKSRLVCPPAIAYGERGSPPVIPGGAALTFEVELISIEAPAAAAEPPSDGG